MILLNEFSLYQNHSLTEYRIKKDIIKNGFWFCLQIILYDFDIRYVLWILILLANPIRLKKPLTFQKLYRRFL